MNITSTGWIGLILVLFLTTFGIFWCMTFVTAFMAFTIGILSLMYAKKGNIEIFYKKCAGNPLTVDEISDGGLFKVVNSLSSPKIKIKTDQRVTGSDLIDSSLQEILGYLIRDYIMPWYQPISSNTDFPETTIKKTAQTLAINISNRIKEIDWLPYLTTQLVDDAASHLRLYRQARAKMKQCTAPKSPKGSPLRYESKISPKHIHKRNKSETDVSWYFGNKTVEKKASEPDSSKLYVREATSKRSTLEDFFFDLECQMENNLICRDVVCTDVDKEKEFLSELIEIILYIVLPDEDFQCKALRFILRELFSSSLVEPLIDLFSDPDYINQAIIWLCLREVTLPSEIFLTMMRLTDNCDELKYTKELVNKEIHLLRSRDSGRESDMTIKQQLSSLIYVSKLIDNRLCKLEDSDQLGGLNIEYTRIDNTKLIKLPLSVILKNNVALSYFIDYVTSVGQQSYLFFYLNVEGWKVSVEQQLSDIHINKIKGLSDNSGAIYENVRTTALSIYEQYLGEKSRQKLQIRPALIQTLYFKIRNLTDSPSELWFDDVRAAVYDRMKTQEQFLPDFYRSSAYIKLLNELDLLSQQNMDDDAISLSSLENVEITSDDQQQLQQHQQQQCADLQFTKQHPLMNIQESHSASSLPPSSDGLLSADRCQKVSKHVRSLSDISDIIPKATRNGTFDTSIAPVGSSQTESDVSIPNEIVAEELRRKESEENLKTLKSTEFTLFVEIIETGIVCERGKTFGIYAVHVSRQYESGYLEEWHIYRRYSDFYDLHSKVKEKFPNLAKIPFPAKKTFHNMDRAVLEKRMRMLGKYLHELCQSSILSAHHGLRNLLMAFLEQGDYDKATSGGPISHTIDTLVNPLKSGMKTIKNMPEQLINTMDEMVEGISKVFHGKSGRTTEASKVAAGLDIESDDNIPLRIMLLLMDEVFDLKSRNQWLRRRIVTLLRQIIRTMFGDIVNRRILDYVSYITSPKNVAHYLHNFKQSFWPNGVRAEKSVPRDESIMFRTRVAAKIALLSCLSDELKHIIGSETTRRGVLTIFELFQKPILNRRLLYVLLEGILCNLLPEKNMTAIFQKLHSKSKRIQGQKNDLNLKNR